MSVPEPQFCERCETNHLTDYSGTPDLSPERRNDAVRALLEDGLIDNTIPWQRRLIHAVWVLVRDENECFTKDAVREACADKSVIQAVRVIIRRAVWAVS